MRLPSVREYPKEVTIGQQVYKIKFVRKIEGEGSTLGNCDPCNHIIKIKLGQSAAETFSTFVHEVLHGVENEHGFELPHAHVYKLERAIADFLMVNF